MLRGYWCIGLAAFLAAATLSAQQAGDARSTPAPIAPTIDRVANELAETRQDQADRYGDERSKREKQDIVAQEESAKWARLNFIAIVLQTFLAGGALTALVLDLRQNRKSVEAQLRAYCSLSCVNFANLGPEHEPKFTIAFINSGQTPAFKMKIDSESIILNAGMTPILTEPDMTDYTISTAGAGGNVQTTIYLGRKIECEEWVDLQNGNLIIWVLASGEYFDIFGKRQTFRVTFFVRGLPDRCELIPANYGNYFT